jgi:transcription termination/antitermination protein NusG
VISTTASRKSPDVQIGRLDGWVKGGEALLEVTKDRSTGHGPPRWHVLWTRSNFEQRVHDRLAAKGLEAFLPKIPMWSRRGGRRSLGEAPMFPGYLFLHHAMDKTTYIDVCKSTGLVSVLGERWDRLDSVPEVEVLAIKQTLEARVPIFPHVYLQEGQRVRIIQGPMTDVEGIFMQGKPRKGLVVISIEMLRRSIAVEVDCTMVAAA